MATNISPSATEPASSSDHMAASIPSPITSIGAESSHADTYPPPHPPPHQCSVCSRCYERLDHLRRHELSHQNFRHHACPRCSRRFNRRDLLSRHLTTHDLSDNSGGSKPRGMERAAQACESCISSKTKCSNQRPCQRCEFKGIACVDGAPRRRNRAVMARLRNEEFARQNGDSLAHNDDCDIDSDDMGPDVDETWNAKPSPSMSVVVVADAPIASVTQHLPNPPAPPSNPMMSPPSDLFGAPLDLGQIPTVDHGHESFMTDIDLADFTFPVDIFSMYQDSEFRFDDTLQSLYSEPFLTAFSDEALVFPQTSTGEAPSSGKTGSPSTTTQDASSRARTLGYEAFKRSPWLWTPANKDHAYAEGTQLSVDETQIMQSEELHCPKQSSFRAPKIRDAASRDEMLSIVLKFSTSNLKIRSFPSFNLLNLLVQAFFVRQNDASDSWIHVPTFDPDRCRSNLLAGIVAAGSTLFAVPNVWKMGLALQEIVRLAVCSSVDEDNRLIRDLQINQPFLMWIEIGLWSGFRRKMEIGEGFAHTAPTMLRRAGAFRQSFYAPLSTPSHEDEGELLKTKWLKWVEQESFKRLVLRLLRNEMRSSIAFNRGPVWSGLEVSFYLPAARDLWDAKSPEEWKARCLSKSKPSVLVTLLEAMHDASKLGQGKDIIDVAFSAPIILYVLWGRVWSYVDSRTFNTSGSSSISRGSGSLWAEAQRQELLKLVRTTTLKLELIRALSPEARLISEFLLMSLHISSDEVQRFAGRYGDEEVLHALPRLREWIHNEDKYYALWHAGQVIKAARSFPPTQLSGFHAIAVYQACLCLWMFTMMKRKVQASRGSSPAPEAGSKQREHVGTSNQATNITPSSNMAPPPQTHTVSGHLAPPPQNDIQRVFLDKEDTAEVQMFLRTGYGRPFLCIEDGFEELSDPKMISKLIADVFRTNFPSKVHPLPPLLENLTSLMKDLGNLQYV